jgi:hypothetical protein
MPFEKLVDDFDSDIKIKKIAQAIDLLATLRNLCIFTHIPQF